jgi:pimeloyl-ACP methyl ester carboxylesterase
MTGNGTGLEVLEVAPSGAASGLTLLFVHGGYHAAWCWELFLPYFAERGHRAVAPSLRGHGGSPGLDRLNSLGLADFETDVRSVLSGLPEPVVLVGHSMGGAIVQRMLAARPPGVVGAALLCSPPPSGIGTMAGLRWLRDGFGPMWRLFQLHQGRLPEDPEVRERLLPFHTFFHGRLTAERRRDYATRVQRESHRAGKQSARRFVKVPETVPVPVLVLGAEQDWFFPPQVQQALAAAYRTEAVLVPDSGHVVMLDQGWRVAADRIAGFLDTVAKGVLR